MGTDPTTSAAAALGLSLSEATSEVPINGAISIKVLR